MRGNNEGWWMNEGSGVCWDLVKERRGGRRKEESVILWRVGELLYLFRGYLLFFLIF